jgi:biopolymer transport protein ExbB
MKSVVILLALAVGIGVAAVSAQAPAPPTGRDAAAAVEERGSNPAGTPPVVENNAPGPDMTRIPAGTAPPKPVAGGGDGEEVNLAKLIMSGGWAMLVLAGMSVITIMMVLMNLFTLRRSAILTPHYMNTADVLLKKRDYLGLLAISSRHSEAIARVVQRTLDFATKNPSASFEVIREIAESEGSGQAASLQHRPTYLADIGMLSPMVGLLGTVWGIIRSFGVLGSGQVAQSRDVLLAAGVSEALVATGSGLILGIIAFMFYALFRNKVQSLISDLEIASAHIVGLLAVNYAKKREPSRAAIEEDF